MWHYNLSNPSFYCTVANPRIPLRPTELQPCSQIQITLIFPSFRTSGWPDQTNCNTGKCMQLTTSYPLLDHKDTIPSRLPRLPTPPPTPLLLSGWYTVVSNPTQRCISWVCLLNYSLRISYLPVYLFYWVPLGHPISRGKTEKLCILRRICIFLHLHLQYYSFTPYPQLTAMCKARSINWQERC